MFSDSTLEQSCLTKVRTKVIHCAHFYFVSLFKIQRLQSNFVAGFMDDLTLG